MSTIRKFLKDESGATAIEYGLIAALVSVAIIAMLSLLGNNPTAPIKPVADNTASTAPYPIAYLDAGIGGRHGRRCRAPPARRQLAQHGSGG
jgi:pilus assembly protein Flp/PilA